jgi:hypothetical protein
MVPVRPFRYLATCSAPGCDRAAVYKIAAPWSDGTSRELKNYGLACEAHRDLQLSAATRRLAALKLSDGESVGPVAVYVLRPGCRDTELIRLEQEEIRDG